MTRVKRAQHKKQRRHVQPQYVQVGMANRNQAPQDELFVPYLDQEHTGKQQDHTMQSASRNQPSTTPQTPHTHTMSNCAGSNTQAARPRNIQTGSSSYHQNAKGHSQESSSRWANYGATGVPMNVTVEGNRSGCRGVAPQPDNNQERATNYTEQSGFQQETGDSYHEQRTNHPQTRWNPRPDDRQEIASWVNAAVTTMNDGVEDEIMYRKMQKRVLHMIDELQEMWQALNRRSPYHKAKVAVHQMMEENSDDHEGMRIASKNLDDAARELGRV